VRYIAAGRNSLKAGMTMHISNNKNTRTALIVCSTAYIAMEAVAFYLSWVRNGLGLFKYYTQDSNLLGVFAFAAVLVCALKSPDGRLSSRVRTFLYISVCCLSLTFTVVIFILAPGIGGLYGFRVMLLSNSMLYQHLLCPLLAFAAFLVFARGPALSRRAPLYALVPTLIYAAATIILNILHLLDGPYPFLEVYNQSVAASVLWVILILSLALVLAFLVARADRRVCRRSLKDRDAVS
jgi:hypothetical protein